MTIKNSDPKTAYRTALDLGQLQPDQRQLEVVGKLQNLHEGLIASLRQTKSTPARKSFFGSLFGKPAEVELKKALPGIYLWGGVGRGKTLLCDMFYAGLPTSRKKRVHFHRFMQSVHDQLKQIKNEESPLDVIAENLARKYTLLVLDEMHVNDITDAMLLSGLLQGLFKRGVTLVTTSNIEPDDLYKDGLQRVRFLPAIEAMKDNLEVVFLGGDIDYRMRLLQNAEVYRSPLDENSDATLKAQFHDLVATTSFEEKQLLSVNGRDIQTVLLADGVAWFEFDALCNTTRSTEDYIEIARSHHTLLLGNVPEMDDMVNDAVRRFINMVDEFYDRGVNLVITAACAPEKLYHGNRLTFEFDRTVSRLREMQSAEYLSTPHRP